MTEVEAVALAAEQDAAFYIPRHGGAAALVRARRQLAGEPVRNAARLALRFLAARALSVVTLGLAAWCFSVAVFAAFGVYLALVNLAWVAVFLRFEQAIVAADDDAGAGAATRLCAVVAAAFVALVAAIAALLARAGVVPSGLAVLFPVALAARAALRMAVMSATRDGHFEGLGAVALLQAVAQPLILVAAIAVFESGTFCLAVADVAGHALAALYLCRRRREALGSSLRGSWSAGGLVATARHWAALPILNLPGSMLALAFVSSPLLILPLTSDAVFAGAVALAFRLFDVPTQIIGAAMTPILMHRLRPGPGEPGLAFDRAIMAGLMLAAGLVYGGMALMLVGLDPWLGGTALAHLSAAVPFVAAFQSCVALSGPLAESCGLYHQQRALALIHVTAVIGSIAAFVLALAASPAVGLSALAVVSIVRMVMLGERLRALSDRSRAELCLSRAP